MEKLFKFLTWSEEFVGIEVKGSFLMGADVFYSLLEHYINTNEHLFDEYSRTYKFLWDLEEDNGDKIRINENDYLKNCKMLSNVFLIRLFKKEHIDKCNHINQIWYNNFLKSISYKQKRQEASLFTSYYSIKKQVLALHGNSCLKCGTTKNITLDHVVPVINGGINCVSNLQPLCKSCNSKKGSRTIDYRKVVKNV